MFCSLYLSLCGSYWRRTYEAKRALLYHSIHTIRAMPRESRTQSPSRSARLYFFSRSSLVILPFIYGSCSRRISFLRYLKYATQSLNSDFFFGIISPTSLSAPEAYKTPRARSGTSQTSFRYITQLHTLFSYTPQKYHFMPPPYDQPYVAMLEVSGLPRRDPVSA